MRFTCVCVHLYTHVYTCIQVLVTALELLYQCTSWPDLCEKVIGVQGMIKTLALLLTFSPDSWPDKRMEMCLVSHFAFWFSFSVIKPCLCLFALT